jgi:hypothetical protein
MAALRSSSSRLQTLLPRRAAYSLHFLPVISASVMSPKNARICFNRPATSFGRAAFGITSEA